MNPRNDEPFRKPKQRRGKQVCNSLNPDLLDRQPIPKALCTLKLQRMKFRSANSNL
jgi:hypothetical protein